MGDNKIYGLLGLARRAGKLSFGTESCKETVERNKAKLVILAEDASDRTKKNFQDMSTNYNIPIRIYGKMEDLSKAIGQNDKAVIAVKDENFAKELIKRIDGGDLLG